MKVLLWKLGALGDVVMTTPLVRQLRRNLPDAQIDYAVGRLCRVVLDGNPHLDRVLEFDERILLDRQLPRLGEIVKLLRGYDMLFVLDKHAAFAWVARLARSPVQIGFRRRAVEGWAHSRSAPYGAMRHEIQAYLDLAAAAGFPVQRDDVSLQLPQAASVSLTTPYVVAINSGGRNAGENSTIRRLPDPLFAELVGHLARRTQVVFVGSDAERSYYEPLAAAYAAENLCGRMTLPQSWGVLAGAECVYTTDTGLMHMAAAVNSKVLALFGPTHPLRKCPPGARWVWCDEAAYDARYELFGAPPRGTYFSRMGLSDILAQDPLGANAPLPAAA